MFDIVVKDKRDDDAQEVVDHHALLPHELFHNVFTHAPALFSELFGTGDMLEQWWSQAAEFRGPVVQ